ncbi:hypothetical protein ACX6XY_21720 [Streptomyces sp. O3]
MWWAALPLAVLPACGTTPDTGQPGVSVPEAAGVVRELGLPFDEFTPSLAEHYTIGDALDAITGDCMERQGYSWAAIDRPKDAVEVVNRRRYGAAEPLVAERFGYHAPPRLLNRYPVAERERERMVALSGKEAKAADTCRKAAWGRITSGIKSPGRTRFNDMADKIMDEAQKNGPVAARVKRWSSCMRGKGFDYPSPFAAVDDPRWWRGESDEPAKGETAVATADVACKAETGLIPAWHAAEERMQTKAIRENTQYFRELKKANEQRVARAKRLLDGR